MNGKALPPLPNELWALIASFLPKADLKNLYFVSRGFFHLAMNEIYNKVTIYHLQDPSTYRCLACMNTAAAARVRTLDLRPHHLGGPRILSWFPDTKDYKFSKFLFKSFGWKEKPREAPQIVASRVLQANIKKMVNMDTLILGCSSQDSFMEFNRSMFFIQAAWTHSDNLRSLTLDIPMECMMKTLSTVPFLPSLQSLNLPLRTRWVSTTERGPIYVHLAAFINAQSSTLTQLSIDTPNTLPDSSDLYKAIGHLPQLTNLALGVCVEAAESPTDFLNRHSHQLYTVKVGFHGASHRVRALPRPDAFFEQPLFKIRFPVLRELDISLLPWYLGPRYADTAMLSHHLVLYLSRYHQKLRSLTISNCVLTMVEVQSIVSAVGSSTYLRRMKFHVHDLYPDILDMLAREFLELEELDVDFDCVNTTTSVLSFSNSHPADFAGQMQQRIYADWSLRYLTIGPMYMWSWQNCRRALCASLPGVVTFNGLSRQEFLVDPDYTRPLSE